MTKVVAAVICSGMILGLINLNRWHSRIKEDPAAKVDNEYNVW